MTPLPLFKLMLLCAVPVLGGVAAAALGQDADGAEPVPLSVIDSIWPGMLMAGGVMMLVWISLKKLRVHKRKRAAEPDLDPTERIDDIRAQATAGTSRVERVMSDAQELTQRLAATLDAKAARIEILLDRTEQATADLEARIASIEQAVQHPGEVSVVGRVDPALLDQARLDQAQAERTGTDNVPLSQPAPLDAAADGQTAARARVHTLADDGLSRTQIARQLELPIGQVELILNLRR